MEISLDRKFFWVKKNLGRKFGLAKFYFGLLRFVCVMLLVTAKLNNNNTEFHWWWVVGGGWVRTHNVVKPTSTWLWLSWVLTIPIRYDYYILPYILAKCILTLPHANPHQLPIIITFWYISYTLTITTLSIFIMNRKKQGQIKFFLAGIQDILGPMWLEECVIKIISFWRIICTYKFIHFIFD